MSNKVIRLFLILTVFQQVALAASKKPCGLNKAKVVDLYREILTFDMYIPVANFLHESYGITDPIRVHNYIFNNLVKEGRLPRPCTCTPPSLSDRHLEFLNYSNKK